MYSHNSISDLGLVSFSASVFRQLCAKSTGLEGFYNHSSFCDDILDKRRRHRDDADGGTSKLVNILADWKINYASGTRASRRTPSDVCTFCSAMVNGRPKHRKILGDSKAPRGAPVQSAHPVNLSHVTLAGKTNIARINKRPSYPPLDSFVKLPLDPPKHLSAMSPTAPTSVPNGGVVLKPQREQSLFTPLCPC